MNTYKSAYINENDLFCNLSDIKIPSNNTFKFLTNKNSTNLYNINSNVNKQSAIKLISDFVDNDLNDSSNNKYLYLFHNIQNKETENGLGNVFKNYQESLFEKRPFAFTKSLVMLFQEVSFDSINDTIYGKGDFYYTPCDLANGHLFIDRKNQRIFGSNSYRWARLQDNTYKYIDIGQYANCSVVPYDFYHCFDNPKKEIEMVQSCKDYFDQISWLYVIEKKVLKIFDIFLKTQSDMKKKISSASNRVINDYDYNSITNDVTDCLSNDISIKEHLLNINPEKLLKKMFPDIDKFLNTLLSKMKKYTSKNKFQQLQVEYPDLFKKMQAISKMVLKYNESDITDITSGIREIMSENIINDVYLKPQFTMTHFNYDEKLFSGKIIVHDISDYVESGLEVIQKNIKKKQTVTNRNPKKTLKFANTQTQKGGFVKNTLSQNNKKLFAISCDERTNFSTNDKNNTKQLCTIFSSDFFDPRITTVNHVLLIGIGVAGPTKNHVALVIANNDFSEVVVNVHLQSGAQGADAGNEEYAIAELDILLNNIIGNDIHPFFTQNKERIKNIRIFGDFNLTSNVIADHLIYFKKNKSYKEYQIKLLLDRIKTQDNVSVIAHNETVATYHPKKINDRKGCIDNVIYITKVKNFKIENVIIGERKMPERNYRKTQYHTLSDHSPLFIIEQKEQHNNDITDMSSFNNIDSLNTFRNSPLSNNFMSQTLSDGSISNDLKQIILQQLKVQRDDDKKIGNKRRRSPIQSKSISPSSFKTSISNRNKKR